MSDDFPSFISCDVNVFRDRKYIFSLGTGVSAVCDFFTLSDKIENAVRVEHSFNFNVDVDIYGRDLLPFLREHYPKVYESEKESIAPDALYTIMCYDLS